MKLLIIFISSLFPTWNEAYRDRHGDAHPNSDWKVRGVQCLITGLLSALILVNQDFRMAITSWQFYINWVKFTISSALTFAALFPYYINFIHLKNGVTTYSHPNGKYYMFGFLSRKEKFDHIVNHLSKSAWPDKTVWWRRLGWKWRMVISAVFLISAILIIVL